MVNGPQTLEGHVGRLKTSAGAFFPGERAVFRGYDLHYSLDDLRWLELYLFGITGRRFSRQQITVIEALWRYTSFPDARLWNNRVAALAGTARSTGNLGIAAALAVSEAQIFGGMAEQRSCDFLIRTQIRVKGGENLVELVKAELKKNRGIGGYGRPIVAADERIKPVMEVVRNEGLNDGPHLRLAFDIEKILLSGRWRLRLNYVALSAALCADMGMSPRDYYFAAMMAFLAGMPPCYLDAVERPAGQLFPIPCRMLSYEGNKRRSWLRP
jgi:hypothetical protein